MPWPDVQSSFAEALRNPALAVPDAVSSLAGKPQERRFNVYRNNVAVSLREALETAFPVVRQLVGDEFFAAMAQVYVARTLPPSPVLIEYGAGFAGFIEGFEPAGGLPYLSGVARLEYARTTAYHAADATPITIAELAGVPADAIDHVRFEFHPSMHLLASDWPVFSIWQVHQDEGTEVSLAGIPFEAETGLIVRPELEVHVRHLSRTAYEFCRLMREGRTLAETAGDVPDLDKVGLSEILSAVFDMQLVTALHV